MSPWSKGEPPPEACIAVAVELLPEFLGLLGRGAPFSLALAAPRGTGEDWRGADGAGSEAAG